MTARPVTVFALARYDRGGPYRKCLTTMFVVRRDCLHHGHKRGPAMYRLSNGRLPEFQPVVTEAEARQWLTENPSAIAWEVAS